MRLVELQPEGADHKIDCMLQSDAESVKPRDDARMGGTYSLIQPLHYPAVDSYRLHKSLEYHQPSTYVKGPTAAARPKTVRGDISGKRVHVFGIVSPYVLTT